MDFSSDVHEKLKIIDFLSKFNVQQVALSESILVQNPLPMHPQIILRKRRQKEGETSSLEVAIDAMPTHFFWH